MTLTKEQSNIIKMVAVLFMIVDHVGAVFYPEQDLLRIIGRLAFPLFAFQLALSFQHTKNHKKQIRILLLFAVISQLPFMWAFNMTLEYFSLNIFFTLLISYLFMLHWESRNWVAFVFGIIIVMSGFLPETDYGLYGILLPFMFYILRKRIGIACLIFISMTCAKAYGGSELQLFATLSIPVILFLTKIKVPTIHVSKWFFYGFYPGHLVILTLLMILTR